MHDIKPNYCRILSVSWSVVCGAILAVAAPRSHLYHLLFGYRYLVITVFALLAYARRLSSGRDRSNSSALKGRSNCK